MARLEEGSELRVVVVWSLWLLVLAVIVAFLVYGLATSEVGGNLVFALLPAGILASVAVVVSQVLRSGVRGSQVVWMAVAVASLVPPLVASAQGAPAGDLGIMQGWTTGLMTMPAGFLTVGLVAVVTSASSPESTGGMLGTVVVWVLLVVPGYIQWFVVLPKVVDRVRSHLGSADEAE